jgi:hypothetical protein
MRFVRPAFVGHVLLFAIVSAAAAAEPPPKPLLRDFIGLNTHTIQFRTELYRPVTRRLRDYHPFHWDVGDDTDFATTFPFARNRVNWEEVYGGWVKAGYDVHVTVMFDELPPPKWKDLPRDARAYGAAFAKAFGPSGERKLVQSVEIGNEPGKYDDASYRTLFENVAGAMRKADPKLLISTCAVYDRASGDYHKAADTVKGLEALYDIVNVHSYAMAEGWPTWRRSFPEDERIAFLEDIRGVIDWRDRNAPGKQVWLTEFGWDASSKRPAPDGPSKDWVDVSDEQQAQFIVRGFLTFAELDLDRAYLYWFNDSDEPSLHAASGITRNYEPKPSFHAMAHLFLTLGDYRFSRVVAKRAGDLFAFEFRHGAEPGKRIVAVWSPTGEERTASARLDVDAAEVERAERMPLRAGRAEAVPWTPSGDGIELQVGESPVYLWLREDRGSEN